MASMGDKANWSDIVALYAQLNTARSKWSFSSITPTNHQGVKAAVTDIDNLNSFITEMQSNNKLTSVATAITPPTVGSLLKPSFLDTLSATISNIQNADNYTPCSCFGYCNHDGWGNGIAYCDQ